MIRLKRSLILVFFVIFIVIFNEYFIYYITIKFGCSWPILVNETNRPSSSKIALISDTHILGYVHGHWFDKLRREWQMYQAFQTFISLMPPDAVFFLGDQFDEGHISRENAFTEYSDRFNSLFYVPKNIKRIVVAGNHDIGFHYEISPVRLNWYFQNFNHDIVEHITIGLNHFVIINSMAMERDGCRLCKDAERKLEDLRYKFNCATNRTKHCVSNFSVPYSRPILMQHFPLYRKSDATCENGPDSASEPRKSKLYLENWDCLSVESTNFVLNSLNPRAVFDGHAHFACRTWWPSPYSFWEWTVPSFSWRNTPQPSILFLTVSPNELKVNKCLLPNENTVIGIYLTSAILFFIYVFYQFCKKIVKPKRHASYQLFQNKVD